jgi:hypothetical protein
MEVKLRPEYIQKVALVSMTEFKSQLEEDDDEDDQALIKALTIVIAAYTDD